MERKLTKVVDGTEITVGGKMCSYGTDVANDLCSWESTDPCGDDCVTTTKGYLEILEFTMVASFSNFGYNGINRGKKHLVTTITVVVAIDLESGNTKKPIDEN